MDPQPSRSPTLATAGLCEPVRVWFERRFGIPTDPQRLGWPPIARGEEEPGAIPSCVLPGITRCSIFRAAESAGVPVERRMLDIEDLLASDEVFLTNSSWGVLPVVAIEKERIGAATVGPLTTRLRQAWLDELERETRGGD